MVTSESPMSEQPPNPGNTSSSSLGTYLGIAGITVAGLDAVGIYYLYSQTSEQSTQINSAQSVLRDHDALIKKIVTTNNGLSDNVQDQSDTIERQAEEIEKLRSDVKSLMDEVNLLKRLFMGQPQQPNWSIPQQLPQREVQPSPIQAQPITRPLNRNEPKPKFRSVSARPTTGSSKPIARIVQETPTESTSAIAETGDVESDFLM